LSLRSIYDLNSAASPWRSNSTGSTGSTARSGASVEHRVTISTLRSIAGRIRFLSTQAADLDAELSALLPQHAAEPALLAEAGVGPVVAAQLLVSWSHRGRVRSEAAFASLAGVAPLEASSGSGPDTD
jgi:transposase